MMALCPACHDMATKGALNERDQRKFKGNPHNKRHGHPSGKLTSYAVQCAVKVGSNVFITEGSRPLLIVDGESLLAVSLNEDKYIEITAAIYSEQNQLLCLIDKNEWITGDAGLWDIESSYQRLILRCGRYNVKLDINTKVDPVEFRATLWFNGVRFGLAPSKLQFRGVQAIAEFTGARIYNQAIVVSTKTQTFEIRECGKSGLVPLHVSNIRNNARIVFDNCHFGRIRS
ncbi:MAG: hypothetical protein M1541_14390 [Acidobacteria bacterium]|nr:hypothetical protein [Acidobacteriota bacterium]